MKKMSRNPRELRRQFCSTSSKSVLLRAEAETEGSGCDIRRFGKIMLRWRCSLWKTVWKQLLCYTLAFFAISFVYRSWLNVDQQANLEEVMKWCRATFSAVPLTFILGFFVNMVIKRWWEFYSALPWPDNLALYLHTFVNCGDERGRLLCRTVVRYLLLAYVLCLRRISPRLSRSIPTPFKLIEMGLATEEELEEITEMNVTDLVARKNKINNVWKNWWIPIQWSLEVVIEGNRDDDGDETGPTVSNLVFRDLVHQILDYKKKLQLIDSYGAFSIVPLAYAQVTSLAVYVYFGAALIGDQWIMGEPLDLYYPFFLTFKFLFYFGWLKVAKALYNPFGDDDEDIDLNRYIDRHIKVAFAIVDQTKYKRMDEGLKKFADNVTPIWCSGEDEGGDDLADREDGGDYADHMDQFDGGPTEDLADHIKDD